MIQFSLGCSTRRDGRVLVWLKTHELAIRSALLAITSDRSEEDVYSVRGKAHMQARPKAAINNVLADNEGFGGIDPVYFKSFIIQ